MHGERNLTFWLRWVGANALSEAVGLSAVLLVGFGVLGPLVAGLPGAWPAIISIAAGVLLGIFEGIIVGGAQGVVLRRRLPQIALRTWIPATVIGAMVAWGLGMLPSTLMAANAGAAGSAAAEASASMPEWLNYVMAALLGLVAGVMLAFTQWLVLRRHVRRAWLWLPANSLAWVVGMPIVFLGMGSIPAGASVVQAIPLVVAATFIAGAVVGAIHGAVLVRLVNQA